MEHSTFPVEICESIIDIEHCSSNSNLDAHVRLCYRKWRSTALVCRAWRARSRLNLLATLVIRTRSTMDQLMHTLTRSPFQLGLAKAIRRVHILPDRRLLLRGPEFIPFIPLAQLIQHGPIMFELNVRWAATPSWYIRAASYTLRQTVTALELRADDLSVGTLLRFIWAMPELRSLHLYGALKHHKSTDVDHGHDLAPKAQSQWARRPASACQNLQDLGIIFGSGTRMPRFPSAAFGDAVRVLELDMRWMSGVVRPHCIVLMHQVENLAECIRSFRALHTLAVVLGVEPVESGPRDAPPIARPTVERGEIQEHCLSDRLPSGGLCVFCGASLPTGELLREHTRARCPARPSTHLLEVLRWVGNDLRTLQLLPQPLAHSAHNVAYGTHRQGLVEVLFGDAMSYALSRFKRLQCVEVTIRDDDARYDARWWTTQIVERMRLGPTLDFAGMLVVSTQLIDQWNVLGRVWSTDPRGLSAEI